MPPHLILPVFAILLFAAVPGAAAPKSAQMLRMADQLDAMDHAEFEAQIAEADRCIGARSFACADTKLLAASQLVTGPGDQQALTAARSYLASEHRAVADEEQAVRDRQWAEYRAAEAEKQAKWARDDAEYNASKAAGLAEMEASGALSVGAQIQQALAESLASQARINAIHNEAMARFEVLAAQRRAREARERDYAQQQRQQQQRSADAAAAERARAALEARRAQEAASAQYAREVAARVPATRAAPAVTPAPPVLASRQPASATPVKPASANSGRSAMACVTASRDGADIVFSNTCMTKVFVVWCGELKYSKQRCGDGPAGNAYYTHSNNIPLGGVVRAMGVGTYQYAACEGGIAFGKDGIQDQPDGSFACLPR